MWYTCTWSFWEHLFSGPKPNWQAFDFTTTFVFHSHSKAVSAHFEGPTNVKTLQ